MVVSINAHGGNIRAERGKDHMLYAPCSRVKFVHKRGFINDFQVHLVKPIHSPENLATYRGEPRA
jgi:hypothetical protein